MLPKIIVNGAYDRETLLKSFGLSLSKILGYEGSEGKIDDLRHFLNFGVNVSEGSDRFSLVVWDADKLSPECQAVLLKPLESTTDSMKLFLIASNENSLLPTVLSRCEIISNNSVVNDKALWWKEILECFSKGPSKCLSLADELDKNEMEEALEEVICKLKTGLMVSVNMNRLKILKLSIECLAILRNTNVNAKLAFGNFLIDAWRLVKT